MIAEAEPYGTLYDTWDAAGNLPSVTYQDSNTATYAYNQQNQMVSASDCLSRSTALTYENAGNLQTATLPNGTVNMYSYDLAERLNKIETDESTSSSSVSTPQARTALALRVACRR